MYVCVYIYINIYLFTYTHIYMYVNIHRKNTYIRGSTRRGDAPSAHRRGHPHGTRSTTDILQQNRQPVQVTSFKLLPSCYECVSQLGWQVDLWSSQNRSFRFDLRNIANMNQCSKISFLLASFSTICHEHAIMSLVSSHRTQACTMSYAPSSARANYCLFPHALYQPHKGLLWASAVETAFAHFLKTAQIEQPERCFCCPELATRLSHMFERARCAHKVCTETILWWSIGGWVSQPHTIKLSIRCIILGCIGCL